MRSPSRGLVLGLGSALAGQAVRGGGLAVVADALLQARRQVGQVARGAGVEGEGLHGARGAGLGAGGRGRGIAVAHEQQVVAAAADALDALEVARTTVDVGAHHVLRLAVDRHVGDRGRAGVDLAAGQQQQRRGEQDGGAHWDLLAGVAMAWAARTNGSSGRRACHMLRNRAMNGWLTASVSGRCLSRRSEEHTSELQSLMRISYAVFCLKKKRKKERNKQQQRYSSPIITAIINKLTNNIAKDTQTQKAHT